MKLVGLSFSCHTAGLTFGGGAGCDCRCGGCGCGSGGSGGSGAGARCGRCWANCKDINAAIVADILGYLSLPANPISIALQNRALSRRST